MLQLGGWNWLVLGVFRVTVERLGSYSGVAAECVSG